MKRLSVLAVILSLLAFSAASAIAASHFELSASLNGGKSFPHAHGSSRFERHTTNRDLDVSLSGVMRLSGQRVVVKVAGTRIGTMLVSSDGMAHRNWDTADGHTVPSVSAGDEVRVTTRKGALVASGTFHRDNGH
jgi:hypothetical protein